MRRWNGWGDETIETHLPDGARDFLRERVGEATPPNDATLGAILARVGPSRLPEHRLVTRDAEARLRASVGQSLEDWLRVRFGRIAAVVDGVAFPETEDEVRDVLAWARDIRAIAIPVGGATSVVGHLTPKAGERPSLAIVMTRLRRLLNVDPLSQLATFEAGVAGPRSRSAIAREGIHARPLSAEFRLRDAWGLDRDPIVRPAVGALRAHRSDVRRRTDRDADRRSRDTGFPSIRSRPRPA